jgi:hypothetical protein
LSLTSFWIMGFNAGEEAKRKPTWDNLGYLDFTFFWLRGSHLSLASLKNLSWPRLTTPDTPLFHLFLLNHTSLTGSGLENLSLFHKPV